MANQYADNTADGAAFVNKQRPTGSTFGTLDSDSKDVGRPGGVPGSAQDADIISPPDFCFKD